MNIVNLDFDFARVTSMVFREGYLKLLGFFFLCVFSILAFCFSIFLYYRGVLVHGGRGAFAVKAKSSMFIYIGVNSSLSRKSRPRRPTYNIILYIFYIYIYKYV